MMRNDPLFQYTYSAKAQEEVQRIRNKYLPPVQDRMTQLRQLDKRVTRIAMLWALVAGVVGVLLFGLGMSCCLVWSDRWFVAGVVIGVVGMLAIAAAYPLYNHVLRREREKAAPEVLRLTDELMK